MISYLSFPPFLYCHHVIEPFSGFSREHCPSFPSPEFFCYPSALSSLKREVHAIAWSFPFVEVSSPTGTRMHLILEKVVSTCCCFLSSLDPFSPLPDSTHEVNKVPSNQ